MPARCCPSTSLIIDPERVREVINTLEGPLLKWYTPHPAREGREFCQAACLPRAAIWTGPADRYSVPVVSEAIGNDADE